MRKQISLSRNGQDSPSAMQQQEWTSQLRHGNFDVYRTMFEEVTPRLWRFACLSVSHDIAEDIVQDVMFDLWQRRDVIRFDHGLLPYLFGAVRKKVAMHLRHDRIVQRVEDEDFRETPPGMGSAPAAPDSGVDPSDLEIALARAFVTLTHMQQMILTLRWEHGLTYEEIADSLSISVAAAKQHGSRAQRVIRQLLEPFRVDRDSG